MIDIFGKPQNVLVLGGSSEIAIEVLRELNITNRIMNLYLAGRDLIRLNQLADEFRSEYTNCVVIQADHDESSLELIAHIENIEIDIAIMASGYLPPQDQQFKPDEVKKVINRNFLAVAEVGSIVIEKFINQNFGVLIIFSSVAAMRPRPDNFLYGASKAGLDNWARGVMFKVKKSGAKILIVRTGMVKTRMSKHLPSAPMTVSTKQVAHRVVKNIKGKKQILWIPNQLKFLVFIIKVIPNVLLAKLSR